MGGMDSFGTDGLAGGQRGASRGSRAWGGAGAGCRLYRGCLPPVGSGSARCEGMGGVVGAGERVFG
jgi:hypothetical protein